MPRALGSLGLSAEELQQHIAWDIGAAAVAHIMSAALDAPLFLQRYSRLVIDCNRPLDAPDSIPTKSGGIVIPGNAHLTDADAAQRVEAIFSPYHREIAGALERRPAYLLVSVHVQAELYGERRLVHAVCVRTRLTLAAPLRSCGESAGLVVVTTSPTQRAPTECHHRYGEPGCTLVE